MKKIMKNKYLIVAASVMVALSSCKNTDLTPTDSITDATFWRTTNDLEQYANGFYGNLGEANAFGDDNTDVRLNNNISNFFVGAYTVPNSDDSWSFNTIRNINYFLNRYQTVKGDQNLINQYVGEVRFFRALEYWGKIKRYGDYPWYEKDLGTSDEDLIFKGRDTRVFILGKIIEDLEFACANMQAKNKVQTGRLYNMVAYSQLARVCLYEGTRAKYANDATFTGELSATKLLEKAAKAAKFVMDNGGYAIQFDAVPYCKPVSDDKPLNYYAMFTQLTDVSSSSETILARIYIKDLVMHGMTRQLPGGTGMTRAMFQQYLCTDGLPTAVSPLYGGDEWLEDELKNRDRRLYQTIDNRAMTYIYRDGQATINQFPSIGGGIPTGYNLIKFRHSDPDQTIANACWTQWYLYRYAETLLIFAEAQAELGVLTQSEVDMTINVLRRRGGVAPLNISSIVTDPNWLDYGYTLSPVLHEVRRERSVELMAEGFRYDDIMRWRAGKLLTNPLAVYGTLVTPTVVKNYPGIFDTGAGTGVKLADYKGKQYIRTYMNIEGGYPWNDKMYLYPVPKEQISLNPKLTQNPGW